MFIYTENVNESDKRHFYYNTNTPTIHKYIWNIQHFRKQRTETSEIEKIQSLLTLILLYQMSIIHILYILYILYYNIYIYTYTCRSLHTCRSYIQYKVSKRKYIRMRLAARAPPPLLLAFEVWAIYIWFTLPTWWGDFPTLAFLISPH